MRVLLAAFNAEKGDVVANLSRHVELLELARSQGCDLAVFPEFSLTGSVDPTRHPQHTLAADAEPVRELVAASHRIGLGAVFGIAERADDGFYISQLYTHGGRLVGKYRKTSGGHLPRMPVRQSYSSAPLPGCTDVVPTRKAGDAAMPGGKAVDSVMPSGTPGGTGCG